MTDKLLIKHCVIGKQDQCQLFKVNKHHKRETNKHSDACIYLPAYKLDVLKIVEYKFSCEMEAHVEVTSLMFDCNTFKDKRHLLILVAITLPSKELQFYHFIMQINSK